MKLDKQIIVVTLTLMILVRYVYLFKKDGVKRKFKKDGVTRRKDRVNALFNLKEINSPNDQNASLTNIAIRKIRENLIKSLGLRKINLKPSHHSKKRSPHNYMLYIYNIYKIDERKDVFKNGVASLSDTIRGCTDIGDGSRRLADFPHLAYKFDISEMPTKETLVLSELKVLMNVPDDDNYIHNNRPFRNGLYRISLYGVFPRQPNNNKRTFPVLLLVHTKLIEIVKGQKRRWITFDVSSFLPGIQGMGKQYIKFVLRVSPYKGGAAINPEIFGIQAHQAKETDKALLVIFTNNNDESVKKKTRKKRGVHVTSQASKARSKNSKRKKKKSRRRRKKKRVCRRKHMTVPLFIFGWSDFLFSPVSYDAYYCQGHCKYPIPTILDPTNHATIQSISNIVEKHKRYIPASCCVPTELAPLPVLLSDGSDRVIVTMKNDMSVRTCGCR